MKKIDFKKGGGLIPSIIQDARTNQVLMLGYMNAESYQKTLKEKRVWFFSRSKKRLWQKGEESGNYLNVIEVREDCDSDAILVKVQPKGGACHTGGYSCFSEKQDVSLNFLNYLYELVKRRKKKKLKNSYTSSLFEKGAGQIEAKVIEEAREVVKASEKETKKRLIEEISDLLFHLIVLMSEKGVSWQSIIKTLLKRNFFSTRK